MNSVRVLVSENSKVVVWSALKADGPVNAKFQNRLSIYWTTKRASLFNA